MFIVLPSVLLLVTSSLADVGECNRRLLTECLSDVYAIANDRRFAFAMTDDELDFVCKIVEEGVNCAQNYGRRCFSEKQQKLLEQSLHGALEVLGDLCHPGPFRDKFLKYTDCMKRASDSCAYQYGVLLNLTDIEYQQDNAISHLHKSCCAYSEFVACSTRGMAEDCGEEAADFVAKYTRRAAANLIHKHCASFLDDFQCVSSSAVLSFQRGLLLLLLLIFLNF